jgi:nucleoside-diphosphate-sugar epimerase
LNRGRTTVIRTVAITGATGFIGRHLLGRLARRRDLALRALTRGPLDSCLPHAPGLQWIRGDLADPGAARALLEPGCVLIDLAFPAQWPREKHREAAAVLAEAAASARIHRVLHCSTAAVAGRAAERVITEETAARPATEYEVTKLAIEEMWRARAAGRYELAILRPTAVFGAGGRNLLKLARDLERGGGLTNYLRSSVFGRRRMNLIPVDNVTAAFEFLLDHPGPLDREIYIVAQDEDPSNNFRDVERLLGAALGVRPAPVPGLPVPGFVLAGLLWLAGRSNANPDRIYDGSKLRRAGLNERPTTLAQGLSAFAAWKKQADRSGERTA